LLDALGVNRTTGISKAVMASGSYCAGSGEDAEVRQTEADSSGNRLPTSPRQMCMYTNISLPTIRYTLGDYIFGPTAWSAVCEPHWTRACPVQRIGILTVFALSLQTAVAILRQSVRISIRVYKFALADRRLPLAEDANVPRFVLSAGICVAEARLSGHFGHDRGLKLCR